MERRKHNILLGWMLVLGMIFISSRIKGRLLGFLTCFLMLGDCQPSLWAAFV